MIGRTHVLGGFSIDAVRYADGSYDVDRLGGNAFWAALGSWLAGRAPEVHTVVGRDYPDPALGALAGLGMHVGGVIRRHDRASTRVSFSYRPDGHRAQPADPAMLVAIPQEDRSRFIDNTGDADLLLAMLPSADDVAASALAQGADAWHLGLLPVARLRDLVERLHGRGHLQADCADREELRRDGCQGLREALPALDAFLPSTSDAAVFLPGVDPLGLVGTFHAWGASTVVLKCGEDGALISTGRRRWHVPVFHDPDAFDPTGAGDVFGGACAAAMTTGDDIVAGAVAGAAAASFATAARTPLELVSVRPEDYAARCRDIAARVEEL